MPFGEKLYQLRRKEGLSQEKLAEMIDVSRQAISKWEQGTVIPDTSNLVKLCNFFDVPLEYLTDENCEDSRDPKRKHISDFTLIVVGSVIILASIIMAYPMQIVDFKIHGESFTYALIYVLKFPLNITLAVGVILSIVGAYRIVKRGKKQ